MLWISVDFLPGYPQSCGRVVYEIRLCGVDDFFANFESFDNQINEWLEPLRGKPFWDKLFYSASEVGDHSLLWNLLASASAVHSLKNEKSAVRTIVGLAIETAVVNGVFKTVFQRKRPVIKEARPLHLRIPRSTSFPSGHSSAAAMGAVLLAEKSKVPALYYTAAAVIALSRAYVRIHHPSDVVAGVGVGAAMGYLTRRLIPIG